MASSSHGPNPYDMWDSSPMHGALGSLQSMPMHPQSSSHIFSQVQEQQSPPSYRQSALFSSGSQKPLPMPVAYCVLGLREGRG